MRIYTKKWFEMMQKTGTAEMFEPVIDKEYTDEDIRQLYQDMMEKYVQEERDAYDEPPYPVIDEEEIEEDSYDPEEYFMSVEEYENRPPFDEKEAREEFEEMYRDNLEEPDEDIADWVRESVDPRLIAMYLLPESVYKRYMEEDAAAQEAFEAFDEKTDEAYEAMQDAIPEEYEDVCNFMDMSEGDYVISLDVVDGNVEMLTAGWDEDGDEIRRMWVFRDAEVIEDEGIRIEAGEDEDGDTVSNCDLTGYEVYFEDGRIEVHLLFDIDDEGLRYYTLRCTDFYAE